MSVKNLQKLFADKLHELENRLGLILAYKNENSDEIIYYNTKLFGGFNERLLEESTKKILENSRKNHANNKEILGKVLTQDEIIREIEKYFEKNNITPIPVEISSTTLSRMAAAYKSGLAHINLRENAEIREKELQSILAHEIGTHVRRFQSGVKNELKIFRSGTANYLIDEE